ncbi:DUF6328 family protein [Streptomyces sp. NBC_00233]|uniref:DUF6328 family protein n=1 Tax=Streptomyces sp. NBC_00233 TaxID=2975686 RepID=UPI00225417C3|nr:DUF6328 family protein [Streptomyces sp. NBC_00233]MCX5231914.1 DUF6328 family protein [Streptomyces sp. NBC_00233]
MTDRETGRGRDDGRPERREGMHGDGDTPREGEEAARGDGEAERGRDETAEERADRQWQDLMQEIRVVQTGVQILLGFLLTVVFTPRYESLSSADKGIYVLTVVLGSLATGALIGPVSFHRLVAGRRIKPETVAWASRLTFIGILLLLATLTTALVLILRVATDNAIVPWLVAGVLAWYLLCWFALPLWARSRYTAKRRE